MLKFEAIQDFKKTVFRTESKLPDYVKKALMANQIQLSDYNREQLMSGRDSKGNKLPNYSPASVAMGKPPGPIRLYDTGDFQSKIKPEFNKEAFDMNSTDDKTEKLQFDYGEEILGINEENLDELGDDISGQVEFQLRKQFKLTS